MTKGTRENIVHSFIALAARYPQRYDFSLTEVANEAGLSRQAVYKNHFSNTREIVAHVRGTIDAEILTVLNTYSKEEDVILFFAENALPILYSNRNWLKILYSTAIDPNWKSFLNLRYKGWLAENLNLSCSHKVGLSEEFVTNLFLNHILTILETWLTQDMPTPPEVFAKQFVSLLETPISEFIRRQEQLSHLSD